MTTNIAATQLTQVQAALATAKAQQTTASVAAVWSLLSSYGDKYAAAAYRVTGQSPTGYGYTVANLWIASR